MAIGVGLIRPDWPAPPTVRAVTTTRAGGVSSGAWQSLNLGNHVGDDPAAVAENRVRLRAALGVDTEPRWLNQVHGIAVTQASTATAAPPTADAMIATRPLEICAVLTADCLPVVLCNDAGTRVAVAHAGWRGLAAGVLEATVAALGESGAPRGSLMAWIGPAIGGAAYEVGDDVRDAFLASDPRAATGFVRNARGRWQLDLPAVARRRLHAAGVSGVSGGDLCTASDPLRFFSYRRDGRCGRQATLVWLAVPQDS